MTDSTSSDVTSLFARSIDKLFDHDTEDAGGRRVESGEGNAGADLKAAVARYMQTAPDDRPGAERQLRSAFGAARAQDRWNAMADTVSALTRLGSSRPEALDLARDLLDSRVASLLVRRVVESSPDARKNRIEVLDHLGEQAARAVARELHDADERGDRRALLDVMVRVGPHAPDVLAEMVEDQRWFVVRNAVAVLGSTGGDVALQHLTGTVVHEDPRVRRETVHSLQGIDDDGAALLILGRLEDGDASVRGAAARAIGASGLDRGLRPLLQLLDHESDDGVVAAVCRALGSIGDPSAVPALEKRASASLFSRPPTAVRVAAYQSLAAIGTPHALSLLERAESDRDATVRAVAAEARRVREG